MFPTKYQHEGPAPGASIRPGDIEGAMRFMDQAYDARFATWVQNSDNILLVTYHLRRISKDYELRRVAHGIRWVTQNWSVEKVAELLLGTTMYQPMDCQGRLVNAVTADWPLVPNTVPVFARFLTGHTPYDAATFVHAATEDWDEEAVCELVAHLGVQLKWNDAYFREVIVHFVLLCRDTREHAQTLRARNMCLMLHKRFATSFALSSNSAHRQRNPTHATEQPAVEQPEMATSQTATKDDVRRRYQQNNAENIADFEGIQSMDLDE